jgi:hypothetical protein
MALVRDERREMYISSGWGCVGVLKDEGEEVGGRYKEVI